MMINFDFNKEIEKLNLIKTDLGIKFYDNLLEYEKKLAILEYLQFQNKLPEFIERTAYFEKVLNKITLHHHLSGIKGIRQFGRGNAYLTHYIYPYKGKSHPQIIKALINIMGLKKGDWILDPMVGSGTTAITSKCMDINCIGLDINPFSCLISLMKAEILEYPLELLLSNNQKFLNLSYYKKYKQNFNFHCLSARERFYLVCFFNAIADEKNGKNTLIKAFYKNLDDYSKTLKEFTILKERIKIKLGKTLIFCSDSKESIFNCNKFDGIITSPPYFSLIDYVKNDLHILNFLEIDTQRLRKKMIGLKGTNKQELIENYWQDITQWLIELRRVLKPNKFLTIIIGDYDDMHQKLKTIAQIQGFNIYFELKRTIMGINNKMKYEWIQIYKNQK